MKEKKRTYFRAQVNFWFVRFEFGTEKKTSKETKEQKEVKQPKPLTKKKRKAS